MVGARRHDVALPSFGVVPVYASARVGRAIDEVSGELDLYHGVRLLEIMEAMYVQGLTNGRAEVFAAQEEQARELRARADLQHRNAGRPRRQ